MKMNRLKLAAAVFTAVFALSGITAFAQSSETGTHTQTETVIEDNRTLTPKGNARLVDDVTDNENLQFITVTARDGNVFYFVIDKGANSENVYFLNTVDESDLTALVEDYSPTAAEPKPEAPPSPEPEQTEQEQPKQPEQKKGSSPTLYIFLALIAAGVIGGYYFKVILPKKKLEDADDIEDFELEETENEEMEDTEDDEEYSDDIENE